MSTQLQPPGEEEQALHRASTETTETPQVPITSPVVVRRRAPQTRIDLVVLWLGVFLMAVLLLVGVINTVQAQPSSGNSPANTHQAASTGQTMK